MTEPLLVADGIHRTFRLPRTSLFGPRGERRALRGVDLAVEPGGSVGIVGESGSGKSTLVRILLGLDRATAGEVRFRGSADRARRRRAGCARSGARRKSCCRIR